MDYLLTSGTKFCDVKIKPKADRDILLRGDSRLLPKTIQFRCSKRPEPNCQYELKYSFWVAPVRIQSVKESDNHQYVVQAVVLAPIEMRTHIKSVPGAIYAGPVHIVIKWPSGNFSGWERGIEAAIRIISETVNRVPTGELELASGRIEVGTRAPHGGRRWVRLATWKGTEPLTPFFHAARTAWQRLTRGAVGSK
jgi:hypothetical protein